MTPLGFGDATDVGKRILASTCAAIISLGSNLFESRYSHIEGVMTVGDVLGRSKLGGCAKHVLSLLGCAVVRGFTCP
jgi:hypothetical protein